MTTQANGHFVDADINPDTINSWTDTRSQARDLWYPSNFTHLEGQTVAVVADSAYMGTEAVASGNVAKDTGNVNHVGLPYTSLVIPSKLDIERLGLIVVKKIIKAIISFWRTLGGEYGDSTATLYPIIFRDRDDVYGSPPALFDGIKELTFDGGYEREGNVVVQQTKPMPMTVRGVILPLGATIGE